MCGLALLRYQLRITSLCKHFLPSSEGEQCREQTLVLFRKKRAKQIFLCAGNGLDRSAGHFYFVGIYFPSAALPHLPFVIPYFLSVSKNPDMFPFIRMQSPLPHGLRRRGQSVQKCRYSAASYSFDSPPPCRHRKKASEGARPRRDNRLETSEPIPHFP